MHRCNAPLSLSASYGQPTLPPTGLACSLQLMHLLHSKCPLDVRESPLPLRLLPPSSENRPGCDTSPASPLTDPRLPSDPPPPPQPLRCVTSHQEDFDIVIFRGGGVETLVRSDLFSAAAITLLLPAALFGSFDLRVFCRVFVSFSGKIAGTSVRFHKETSEEALSPTSASVRPPADVRSSLCQLRTASPCDITKGWAAGSCRAFLCFAASR